MGTSFYFLTVQTIGVKIAMTLLKKASACAKLHLTMPEKENITHQSVKKKYGFIKTTHKLNFFDFYVVQNSETS